MLYLVLTEYKTSFKIYSACRRTAGGSISDVTEIILLQHGHCNLPPDGLLQFRDGSGPRHSEQRGQLALDRGQEVKRQEVRRSRGQEVRRSGGHHAQGQEMVCSGGKVMGHRC